MPNTSSTPNTPAVARVQAEFEAALAKDGLVHTFEWMSGWFDQVAHAQVSDELTQALGEHAQDPQARSLQALDMLMSLATSASNTSSSPSANLMRLARLTALANIVEGRFGSPIGYASRASRNQAWEAWRQQTQQPLAGQPSQAS